MQTFIKLVIAVGAIAPRVLAGDPTVQIHDKVVADRAILATVDTTLFDSKQYSNYTAWLVQTVDKCEDAGGYDICILDQGIPTTQSYFAFVIPSDAVSSKASYNVFVSEGDPIDEATGRQGSGSFEVIGAKSNLSSDEAACMGRGIAFRTPCSTYACIKACAITDTACEDACPGEGPNP